MPQRTRASLEIARAWGKVIVLSNRAPVQVERDADGRQTLRRSASGVVTALEPLVEACSGVWVAGGESSDDFENLADRRLTRPPSATSNYRLRSVRLSDAERRGYYYGFSNEGLWPLCHELTVPAIFRPGDFEMYRGANARFAAAVVEEATSDDALVLVQDYHFALAPRLLRSNLISSIVTTFWHIPWPSIQTLRACPFAQELLDGLLGSDIIGFQTHTDCLNFLGAAESVVDADVDYDRSVITFGGRSTHVRSYPVGVQWANRFVRTTQPSHECREKVRREFGLKEDVILGLGIDRLDYTKGIPEKCWAIERLLERHPELRGRFVFIQVAEPSRDCLSAYCSARTQVVDAAERVNARFGIGSYQPIRLIETHQDSIDVYRYYRAANVCYVGSLRDGMNLVAKEFVSARDDKRGVLVLSEFAGSAIQLRGAVIVNPYLIEEAASALAQAVAMSDAEQSRRMRLLRTNVAKFDTYWWAHTMLHDALSVKQRYRGQAECHDWHDPRQVHPPAGAAAAECQPTA